MKRLALALLGLFCAGQAVPASAGPMILTRVYEDNQLVAASSTSAGVDAVGGVTSSGRFYYGAAVSGVPVLDSPSLAGASIGLSSLFGFSGEHTLTFAFSQTGLSSTGGGGLLSQLLSSVSTTFLGFTDMVKSVTLGSWMDAGNSAFGMTTLIGSQTFTSDGSQSFSKNISLPPGSLFSETILISAVFRGGGASVVSTASINGVSSPIVAVPEPASLLVFGTALLLFGCAMRLRGRRVAG
ncbi:PEP-CTERM sorting domain-containing protein [Roseomonas terrae]|jgi:hypothetical protein|uniref:PEP-CTERM sorting domain-containing protein n=1 Tax=Neoroseomonas terrae TaxID=424799 RepID=A0ABS5EKF6_9PROT|nr:PEP-CTERM sorting domain-containing protein [Neoroseomonas terrae]MBR0651494.1 PEP-CTERM sorting domain-containing protein [Neoroseomonas terrae]